jgi:hypothetical protein
MKQNKWIAKAFVFLGYAQDDDNKLNTVEDINLGIKDAERSIGEMEDVIVQANELIEHHKKNIEFLNVLKDQAEIEEFKAMNPKAKVVYKF